MTTIKTQGHQILFNDARSHFQSHILNTAPIWASHSLYGVWIHTIEHNFPQVAPTSCLDPVSRRWPSYAPTSIMEMYRVFTWRANLEFYAEVTELVLFELSILIFMVIGPFRTALDRNPVRPLASFSINCCRGCELFGSGIADPGATVTWFASTCWPSIAGGCPDPAAAELVLGKARLLATPWLGMIAATCLDLGFCRRWHVFLLIVTRHRVWSKTIWVLVAW